MIINKNGKAPDTDHDWQIDYLNERITEKTRILLSDPKAKSTSNGLPASIQVQERMIELLKSINDK